MTSTSPISSDCFEDEIIFVDFPSFENTNFLSTSKNIVFNNIDDSVPSCDIDGCSFVGSYEVSLGSLLFVDPIVKNNDQDLEMILSMKSLKFVLEKITPQENVPLHDGGRE